MHRHSLLLTVHVYLGKICRQLIELKFFVLVPPSFIQKPNDLEITEGTTAEFDCSISGKPQPVVKWTKNGLF
jgi:hypothetical protein